MNGQLQRDRLLLPIEHAPGLWLVESCAGSGKSVLAKQLGARLGVAVDRGVPTDPASERPLVVDWADHPDGLARLLRMVEPSGDHHVVLLARRFGPDAIELADQFGARWLRAADLWFDEDELRALAEQWELGPAAHHVARSLHSLTDGWPVAVGELLTEVRRHRNDAPDLGSAAEAAFSLAMKSALDRLSDTDQTALTAIAFFPRFDDAMAALLDAPDALDTLVDHGIPLRRDKRWASLGPVARSWLMRRSRALPDVGQKLFGHLVDEGHALEAIAAAVELDREDLAIEVFSSLDADEATVLDAGRVGALWPRLESAAQDHPRAFLVRARQVLASGEISAAVATLSQGIDADRAGFGTTTEELRTELGFVQYLSGDLEQARSLIDTEELTSDVANARRIEVLAGLEALTMHHDAMVSATHGYKEAERRWRKSGQRTHAGVVLSRLAMEVTSRVGRLPEAIALLDSCLQTIASHPMRIMTTRLMRARLYALAGDHAHSCEDLDHVEGLLGMVLRSWMAAHAHQARALMASHRRDVDDVQREMALANASLGPLARHAPGAAFHADGVEVFCRVGDLESAASHLEALRAHPGAEPPDVTWAEVVFNARVANAEDALAMIDDRRRSVVAVPGGQWKLDFEQSVALRRLGRKEEADQAASRAQLGTELVGTPAILELTERRIEDRPSAKAAPSPPARECAIRLFPSFGVLIDGAAVDVPKGRGQTTLKLLALHDGALTTDALIDALWPESNPDLGRRRLRNVLSRVRQACGDVIDRDGAVLRLAPSVTTDFQDWWSRSVEALADPERHVDGLARLAHEAPTVLLEADRYEEWLQPLQRRYQLQLIRILDSIAAHASATGETEVAVGALERCLEIDPFSTERVETAASLLDAAGRGAAAAEFRRGWQVTA